MKRALHLMAATLAVAVAGDAVAGSGAPAPHEPPFSDTHAAAKGREVPAQVEAQYQDRARPRVVGADARGQEYAISRGSGGICLIGVRAAATSGFEVCGPARERDMTTMTAVADDRLRTVVLQARATKEPPAQAPTAAQVAPGLWVAETAGALPGG